MAVQLHGSNYQARKGWAVHSLSGKRAANITGPIVCLIRWFKG